MRDLLKLRRRSDKVKLSLLLFLLGIILAIDLLTGAAEYLIMAGEPVEYVLSPGAEGAAPDVKIQQMLQRESVISVSRQREYTLVNEGRTVTAAEVSPEYLSACFGLEPGGAGAEFFLGKRAFAAFCGAGVQSPARLVCQAGEESVSGAFILAESLPEDLTLTKGTSVTLSGARSLRVMLRGKDLSGVETTWLQQNGFTIENREALTETTHKTQLLLIKLRYGGAACALALLLGRQLYKAGRRGAGDL